MNKLVKITIENMFSVKPVNNSYLHKLIPRRRQAVNALFCKAR